MKLKELLKQEEENGRGPSGGLLERAHYYWLLLKRLHGDPQLLARGVALGIFIGITPTIPLHTISIVCLSPILRASPISAFVASLVISNPVTIPMEYYASWKLGTLITGFSIPWEEIKSLLNQVEHTGLLDACLFIVHKSMKLIGAMLIGGVSIALPISILTYYLSLNFYQKRAEKKKMVQEQA